MAKYGRLEDIGGTLTCMEVADFTNQAEIDSTYHPTVAAQWTLDPNNEIADNWTHDGGNPGVWSAPSGPAAPTANDIKAEARKRINVVMPGWMIDREVSGGTAITQTVKDYAANIRTDSGVLEGTLPSDYTDDSHWTAAP